MMKIPHELVETAYHFFDAKIWNDFYDDEVFAVHTESGEDVFCSILGHEGTCFALNMYVGEAGWNSFLQLHYDAESMAEQQEFLFSQVCLQVSFDLKYSLHPDTYAQLKDYAKSKGEKLKGPRYANFLKLDKMKVPWPINSEKDFSIIRECLDVVFFVAERRSSGKLKMGAFQDDFKIPRFTKKGETYVKRMVTVSDEYNWDYKCPISKEYTLIKESPKSGVLYCDLMFLPMPIGGNPELAPVYPHGLMAITENDLLLLMEPLLCYDTNPLKFVESLVKGMTQRKFFPKKIIVRNERTLKLLFSFCDVNGIEIEGGKLKYIDDAYSDMLEHLGC